jgi:hypothetical protein
MCSPSEYFVASTATARVANVRRSSVDFAFRAAQAVIFLQISLSVISCTYKYFHRHFLCQRNWIDTSMIDFVSCFQSFVRCRQREDMCHFLKE